MVSTWQAPAGGQAASGWRGLETQHLPCLPPQDLHHLGHQQLVPQRASPSGPGGPRRSPTRRQPQPVPQRHFNGNHRLGGQAREVGEGVGGDLGSRDRLLAVRSVMGPGLRNSGVIFTHEAGVTQVTRKSSRSVLWSRGGVPSGGRGLSEVSLRRLKTISTESLQVLFQKDVQASTLATGGVWGGGEKRSWRESARGRKGEGGGRSAPSPLQAGGTRAGSPRNRCSHPSELSLSHLCGSLQLWDSWFHGILAGRLITTQLFFINEPSGLRTEVAPGT